MATSPPAQPGAGPILSFTPQPNELPYYSGLFSQADRNQSGIISGADAVNFLSRSKLPVQLLKNIWLMADKNPKTNALDQGKFFIAVRLIQLFQNGQKPQGVNLAAPEGVTMRPPFFEGVSGVTVPYPGGLPQQQHQQPVRPQPPQQQPLQHPPQPQLQHPVPIRQMSMTGPPSLGNLSAPSSQRSLNQSFVGQGPPQPIVAPLTPNMSMVQPGSTRSLTGQMQPSSSRSLMGNQMHLQQPSSTTSLTVTDPYTMLPHEIARYDQLFPNYESKKDGYVYGPEAVALFSRSSVPKPHLRDIWNMVDNPVDNRLSKLEFAIAMHLIVCVSKKGLPLPDQLPASLQQLKDREAREMKKRNSLLAQPNPSPATRQPSMAVVPPPAPTPTPSYQHPQLSSTPTPSYQHSQLSSTPTPSYQHPQLSSTPTPSYQHPQPSPVPSYEHPPPTPSLAPAPPPARPSETSSPPKATSIGGPTSVGNPTSIGGPSVGGMSITDAFSDLDTTDGNGLGTDYNSVAPSLPATVEEPPPLPKPASTVETTTTQPEPASIPPPASGIPPPMSPPTIPPPTDPYEEQPPQPTQVTAPGPSSSQPQPPPSSSSISASHHTSDPPGPGTLFSLQQSLQQLQAENISLKAQLSSFSDEEMAVTRQTTAIVAEISTLARELAGLRAGVAEAKVRLVEKTSELKKGLEMKGLLTEMIKDTEKAKDALETAAKEVSDLKDSLSGQESSANAVTRPDNITQPAKSFSRDLFGFDTPRGPPESQETNQFSQGSNMQEIQHQSSVDETSQPSQTQMPPIPPPEPPVPVPVPPPEQPQQQALSMPIPQQPPLAPQQQPPVPQQPVPTENYFQETIATVPTPAFSDPPHPSQKDIEAMKRDTLRAEDIAARAATSYQNALDTANALSSDAAKAHELVAEKQTKIKKKIVGKSKKKSEILDLQRRAEDLDQEATRAKELAEEAQNEYAMARNQADLLKKQCEQVELERAMRESVAQAEKAAAETKKREEERMQHQQQQQQIPQPMSQPAPMPQPPSTIKPQPRQISDLDASIGSMSNSIHRTLSPTPLMGVGSMGGSVTSAGIPSPGNSVSGSTYNSGFTGGSSYGIVPQPPPPPVAAGAGYDVTTSGGIGMYNIPQTVANGGDGYPSF